MVIGVQAFLQELGNFVQVMLLDVVQEFPQVCLTSTKARVERDRDKESERQTDRQAGEE